MFNSNRLLSTKCVPKTSRAQPLLENNNSNGKSVAMWERSQNSKNLQRKNLPSKWTYLCNKSNGINPR